MAEQIYLNDSIISDCMHDIDSRMTKIIDQLYSVDRGLKDLNDYLYDENLSGDFYFNYTNQHDTINELHDNQWAFRNSLDTFYEATSHLIDTPFKKDMEQFVERLSQVDISRYDVSVNQFAVQGETWQPGVAISAPSTRSTSMTYKDSITFTDLMNSPFTRRMKQVQYELFLEQTGQMDFQINYDTFINTLYRQADFDYETGLEKVSNIITTGLVIVCVGGVIIATAGAAGFAVPTAVSSISATAATVSGTVLTAKDAYHALSGLDVNGNPLTQAERNEVILSAGTDIAFMIAGFGLNKILKNAKIVTQSDEFINPDKLKQYQVIDDVKNGNTLLDSSKVKGNFGEMVADNYIEDLKDATRIGKRVTTLNDKLQTGIDGVYECASPPPKYIIAEAKFNTSQLKQTQDGLQMSESWILGSNRLEKAVGPEIAELIKDELLMHPENVQSILVNIDVNGNAVESILDSAGKK
ncbi:hypothetical protein [Listeria sp. ILCC792]|uniref:hypothetical protein n=1 Tax=Listeria sp. ILCC792 TaxID=1918331 RepID=UPI002101C983|nr:hypothetical protein [Listeria sp. ILCC792]